MNNKKGFKTISIILALICIVFLSIFLRYRYELHSLKNEIVNNKVIKVYFEGSGYTANIESDEDKKEFFNLISDFKFRFKNTMEDTEKSSPSVETEFNGNEIFLFVYSKTSRIDFNLKNKYYLLNYKRKDISEKSLIKLYEYEKFCKNYKEDSNYKKLKQRNQYFFYWKNLILVLDFIKTRVYNIYVLRDSENNSLKIYYNFSNELLVWGTIKILNIKFGI